MAFSLRVEHAKKIGGRSGPDGFDCVGENRRNLLLLLIIRVGCGAGNPFGLATEMLDLQTQDVGTV